MTDSQNELVDKFIDGFNRSKEPWLSTRRTWVFRGQGKDWKLKPQLFRTAAEDPEAHEILDRISVPEELRNQTIPKDSKYTIEDIILAYKEFKIIRKFVEIADREAITLPGDDSNFRKSFKTFCENEHNITNLYSYLKSWPDNNWDYASALCKHYKLPTRLLDFTKNPLVALYFAAKDSIKYPDGEIIVWAVKIDAISKSSNFRKIELPGAWNPNLAKQQGLFLGDAGINHITLSGYSKGLEEYSSITKRNCEKHKLNKEHAGMVLKKLRAMDYDNAKILEGMNAVGEAVKERI